MTEPSLGVFNYILGKHIEPLRLLRYTRLCDLVAASISSLSGFDLLHCFEPIASTGTVTSGA